MLDAAKRILLVTLVAWSHAGFAPGARLDPLQRPALVSSHAGTSVLLAITQAGGRLLAVGERGIVLYSDDGALSWRQARVPVSVSLTNVRFVTKQRGWAVGHLGVVLRTDDGGATWIKQRDGSGQLQDAQRTLAEGPDKPFFDVHFSDEDHGFIVGAHGQFFKTNDGGNTWLPWQDHIDNPRGKHLYGIAAHGASLYIAGEEGALYRSTDGGQTFAAIKTPYRGSYFGLIYPLKDGDGSVLVFGLRGNAYLSHDAGENWRKIETGTSAAFTAGRMLADGAIVLVSQAGEVLQSVDDGLSWRRLPVTHPFPFSGLVQASDDALILSGGRGIGRVSLRRGRG